MAFEKGISGNPAGRPVGSKNRIQSEIQERIADFLSMNLGGLQDEYDKLEPAEKLKFIGILLAYAIPKYKLVDSNDELKVSRIKSTTYSVVQEQYRLRKGLINSHLD